MFDFSPNPETEALVARTRRFVDDVVIPREAEVATQPQRLEAIRSELQQAARDAGLFAPRVPCDHDGLGLDWRDSAPVFETAGRSLLGPQALNCAAPDEGNMHLLHAVGTAEQREPSLELASLGRMTAEIELEILSLLDPRHPRHPGD